MGMARGLIPSSGTSIRGSVSAEPPICERASRRITRRSRHVIEIRDFFEGAPLAFFGALSVAGVEKGEVVRFAGDGCGYAGVHSAAQEDYGFLFLRHAAEYSPIRAFVKTQISAVGEIRRGFPGDGREEEQCEQQF